MKSLLEISRPRLRSGAAAMVLVSAALACGVVEHPHPQQAVDHSNDFGPLAGAATIPAAAGGPSPTGGTFNNPGVGGAAGSFGFAGQGGSGTPLPSAGAGGASPGAAGASPGAAGAPSSGVTITLGGVNVPKEKAIAFIHIGHSNMYGEASTPFSSRAYHYTETNPHGYMYKVGSSPTLCKEPTAGGPGAGPGTALVKEAIALAPDYYFISLGYGQPSAYCSQFVPGGLYYDDLIAASKAIKGRVTFGAIFIYLGITERHGTAADVNGFPDCINTLVSAIRKDVGEPNLPALMNDYEVEASGEFVVGGAVYNAIYPQIQKTPSVVSNFALVSAATLAMQDDHHFNFDGQRTWAQRALKTMKDKGWFPWAP
ncbi:MAG TPA: sialate O-acetylesterase [Polyangiaceae bacterium]|nr:sialate O-acetylesterase [Polyangiaceae bacterium]